MKWFLAFFLSASALAQTQTTYTGVIKDLSQQVVTSGQVTFTLALASSSTIPGVGTFVPTTTTCNINTDGTMSGYVGGVVSGGCMVTMNTALTPTGTAYRICIQPYFNTPGSCFFDYAITATKDITTVVPTLQTGPINYGGVQGPPIPFMGTWSSTTTYQVGQAVAFNNAVYISLQNPNLNQNPGSSPTFWSVMLSPASLIASPSATQNVAQPAGTGFVVNNLVANGVFNPLAVAGADLGAKLNTVITACAGAACPIYIPAGSYTFTTPIVAASNVELYGAGEYLTILLYTGVSGTPMVPGVSSGVPGSCAIHAGTGTTNVKVHDLSIQGTNETIGNYASYNNVCGILLEGTHSVVDKVKISHFWGYTAGITIHGSFNTVSNSDVQYTVFGISAIGDHHSILNNYMSNHYSLASTTEPADALGHHFWDGVVAEGMSYSLIQGNTAEDNAGGGIYTGGGGSFSTDNRYIANHVLHSWGRGFDFGVTGDESSGNGHANLTITGNTAIDNNTGNYWLICDQNARMTGNYSEFTSNYPTFFGSQAAIGTRSGITLSDICGTASPDTVNNASITGNTAIDYLGLAALGLNFNIKATSVGNTFTGNSTNASFFISTTADLTQNFLWHQTTIPSLITTPLVVQNNATQLTLNFDSSHSVALASDAAGGAFFGSTAHVYHFNGGIGFDTLTITPTGVTSSLIFKAPLINSVGPYQFNGTSGLNHTTTLPCTGTQVFSGGILTAVTGSC